MATFCLRNIKLAQKIAKMRGKKEKKKNSTEKKKN